MPRKLGLTTRLTAFFLAALALVLAGFCAALYGLAQASLSRQTDERLASALQTLTAAVEFNHGRLEWEPDERHIVLGEDQDSDAVRWTVRDESGRLVSGSRNLPDAHFLDGLPLPSGPEPRRFRAKHLGRRYRVLRREITALGRVDQALLQPGHYARLFVTAAVDLGPTRSTLATLARAEVGLSLALWFLAAAGGRALCRKALAPLARMAEAARSMSADEFGRRLPEPDTGDEIQGLAEAFNGLLSRLADAYERQSRFAGDASHQLRTPLSAMLGQVDVALRRPRDGEDYQRVLGLVRDRSIHLSQIVEALLFLARNDAESARPELSPVDLSAWAREHEARWTEHPRSRDLSVIAPADGEVFARVHPPLLGQLVGNLVENALKYTEPGTPVRLRVSSTGDSTCLAVEDEGPGVAFEDLPHLFVPFFRASDTSRLVRPGVGLGLAVAQRIAASFDGSVSVESRQGRGCTFLVTLPRFVPVDAMSISGQPVTGHV